MRAAVYEAFRQPLIVGKVPDPEPALHGTVIRVAATGVCMSDWHGWMGHDPDIRLPHVPGHELAGEVVAVGAEVREFSPGDRVTVPFVCGCGTCEPCVTGNQQVCDRQTQPGFTHWGSYAEYVAIMHADENLVQLPEWLGYETAASLGCRFATAYRAVVDQGAVTDGQWVTVHGCGGVGLSAVMIAVALGASVIAVDPDEHALALALELGATVVLNPGSADNLAGEIVAASDGGVHCSVDAFGDSRITACSIRSLRKRGRHVQVGLMVGEHSEAPVPFDMLIAKELQVMGSHGMQAHRYTEMLGLIESGRLEPERLIQRTTSLDCAALELASTGASRPAGVTVINAFGA